MTDDGPPRPADLPPGVDSEDPYYDENVKAYPDWWRCNIREFRTHGMREYRPPRFRDGVLTTELIGKVEDELSTTVRLQSINPQEGNDWEVLVDGDRVATIGRHREGAGFTIYEIDSDEFVDAVRSAVESDG